MKEQVMVNVIVRVECSERQPYKLWREMSLPHSLPEQSAPLDVIVTVKIAAADRLRCVLQLAYDKTYYDCAEDQKDSLYSRLSTKEPNAPLRTLDLHIIGGHFSDIMHKSRIQNSESRSQNKN